MEQINQNDTADSNAELEVALRLARSYQTVLFFLWCPPGMRFNPTDAELILYYLQPMINGLQLPINSIHSVNIYKYNPDCLAANYSPALVEKIWYFFTSRQRKYRNGSRPNRKAGDGYWKATGADKAITIEDGDGPATPIGYRKALVFYQGKAPKGKKTSWIMHEFRVFGPPQTNTSRREHDDDNEDTSMRLDDFVLCRIYKKEEVSSGRGSSSRATQNEEHLVEEEEEEQELEDNAEEHDDIQPNVYREEGDDDLDQEEEVAPTTSDHQIGTFSHSDNLIPYDINNFDAQFEFTQRNDGVSAWPLNVHHTQITTSNNHYFAEINNNGNPNPSAMQHSNYGNPSPSAMQHSNYYGHPNPSTMQHDDSTGTYNLGTSDVYNYYSNQQRNTLCPDAPFDYPNYEDNPNDQFSDYISSLPPLPGAVSGYISSLPPLPGEVPGYISSLPPLPQAVPGYISSLPPLPGAVPGYISSLPPLPGADPGYISSLPPLEAIRNFPKYQM